MSDISFQKTVIIIVGVIVGLFFVVLFLILIDAGYFMDIAVNEGCIDFGYERSIQSNDIQYCVNNTIAQQIIADCEGLFFNKQCDIILIKEAK